MANDCLGWTNNFALKYLFSLWESEMTNNVENLQSIRQSLVVRRRDLAHRGAMSPADGGRSATQIMSLQAEIQAIDNAIADEVAAKSTAASPA